MEKKEEEEVVEILCMDGEGEMKSCIYPTFQRAGLRQGEMRITKEAAD